MRRKLSPSIALDVGQSPMGAAPVGGGLREIRSVYERLADELDLSQNPPIVFSIADCLAGFLSNRYDVFYCDGHLTCIRTVP